MQRVAINERRGMLLPELHPEYASVGAGSCGLPRPGGERVGVRGFGIAGRVSDRPEPPHPALSPLGRGRRTRSLIGIEASFSPKCICTGIFGFSSAFLAIWPP